MQYRYAEPTDVPLLAAMNLRLIRDEAHRNPMTLPQLEERMAAWLQGEYRAILFEGDGTVCGYALFRREPDYLYLRHFFVERAYRRQGIGRAAIEWLCAHTWKDAGRIRLDVLTGNEVGIAFWRSVGFTDYSLTLERDRS